MDQSGRVPSPELTRWLGRGQVVYKAIEDGIPNRPRNALPQKSQLFVASFHLNHDFHGAILHLLEAAGAYDGAAFALLRPIVDSYVKGMWMLACASDENIERTIAGESVSPPLVNMMDAVDKLSGQQHFSQIRLALPALHSFTHGGFEQLVRRFDPNDQWNPSYTDEERISLVFRASWTSTAFARMYCIHIDGPDSAGLKTIVSAYEENLRTV